MADRAVELEYIDSVSHETVRSVLKKRAKTVEEKRMGNPPLQNIDFVVNMENVLSVYKHPYDPVNPVICMDKSPKQSIKEIKSQLK